MRLLGDPAIEAELIVCGQRKTCIGRIAIDVIRLDRIEAFSLTQIQRSGVELNTMALMLVGTNFVEVDCSTDPRS